MSRTILRALTCTLLLSVIYISTPTPAYALLGSISGSIGGGGDRVTIVADTSRVGQEMLQLQQDISTFGGIVSEIQRSLETKENVEDPILWNLGKTIIQDLVANAIEWMNSGFDGDPAFVTDLGEYLETVADQVQAEFVYGEQLDALDDGIEFSVRATIAQVYRNQGTGLQYNPQTTLEKYSDDPRSFRGGEFSEGAYPAWFELILGSQNDPNKAFLNADIELRNQIKDAQENEKEVIGWGDGIFSLKKCDSADGKTDCTITTPGSILQDTFSFQVGELPALQLLQADEVNEVISATMTNLSNQLFEGVNGLLGLGGNAEFSSNNYGDNGSQSYLTALRNDNITEYQKVVFRPLLEAIEQEKVFQNLLGVVAAAITTLEESLDENETEYPGCFDLDLSNTLQGVQDENESLQAISDVTLTFLETLQEQYEAATNAQEQQAVFDQFNFLNNEAGLIKTITSNRQYENVFIKIQVAGAIEAFLVDIEEEVDRCASNS